MGRIIVASALGGWLAIVAIAIDLNSQEAKASCYRDAGCLNMFAARADKLLIGGLAVALALIIVSMIIYAATKARRGDRPIASSFGWRPANRGQQTRLR